MAEAALVDPKEQPSDRDRWALTTRIAFRFFLVYFGLYCLTNQIVESLIPIPNLDIPDPGSFWPLRQIVTWTAAHVFRVTAPLMIQGSGSGDKTFDWVLDFCLLITAGIATALWSVLDRRRRNYSVLHNWARFALRFAIAGQMLSYAFAKVVPLQMPFPSLRQLIEPYGNFSPMGVLWSSIGAAPGYEIFAGCAELLAGILLIIPRTTTLGALVCVVDTVQVFMLNMTYDIPVKLLSFQLLLMSLLLLAPEFTRMANFFILNRDAARSKQPALFRSRRANRFASAGQVAFGIVLIASNAYGSWTGWNQYGGGLQKSPLYGIWQVRTPLFNDWSTYRRAIFDFPGLMWFQKADDSFLGYRVSIDTKQNKISMTTSKGNLTYQRVGKTSLVLDGAVEGNHVHMDLQLMDRDQFLLVSRGFHWIQEYPFNR